MKAVISSTKFDGSLHYQFEADLVQATDREIRVYTPPGVKLLTYRGELMTRSHSLRIFYTDLSWNVMIRWHADWRFEEHYVNIADPATWDGRVVRWVDLDLDLIRRAGSDEPVLDDEQEFERHRIKWGYPEKLVQRVWQTVEQVWQLMRDEKVPFDEQTCLWRPSGP
ncbi:MAG: UPF0374 protein YjjG [Phycisphaerae bacterium]|jgi:protein associated with RNAse G/E|nr:MAG: UPF0374 protein YjjG [Phycisphaerae bacterium]